MRLFKHGDGFEGQDITHLLDNTKLTPDNDNNSINMPEITKVLADKANTKGHIALRGEIIIKNTVYDAKYSKMYPKARSLISGQVNAKRPDDGIVSDMEIVFYEFIYPGGLTFQKQFEMITHLGFNTAKYKIFQTLEESQLPEILMTFKRESAYEIDGIVLDDSSKVWPRSEKIGRAHV